MGVRQLPVYVGLAGLTPLAVGVGFYRGHQNRDALRWWGVIAFAAVILQGVLGGLRVVLYKDQIGIFHAALAQLFFVLVCAIALFTSRWWQNLQNANPAPSVAALQVQAPAGLRWLLLAATLLLLGQLVLGATMRHQHAGLAIPDFPLAYGKLWPATDPESVARYNQQRMEITAANPITAFQIGLQMTHRVVAVLILGAVSGCAWLARRRLGPNSTLARLTLVWLALILIQVLLGAATIWSNKAADIATAHVLVGALSLALGALLSIVLFRAPGFARREANASTAPEVAPQTPFGLRPSATGVE
jgi:cytochrome c oxidase assembly protein subunit 15